MTRIILHGCNGAMGQMIADLAKDDSGFQIAAEIDPKGGESPDKPVYASLKE